MMPDFGSGKAAGKNEPATKPPYTGSHHGVSLAIPSLSEALLAPSTELTDTSRLHSVATEGGSAGGR